MIRVTNDFYVNRDDVSAIEWHDHTYYSKYDISDNWPERVWGTIVILKNGRKVFLEKMKANEVYEAIFGTNAVSVEGEPGENLERVDGEGKETILPSPEGLDSKGTA